MRNWVVTKNYLMFYANLPGDITRNWVVACDNGWCNCCESPPSTNLNKCRYRENEGQNAIKVRISYLVTYGIPVHPLKCVSSIE